MLIGRHILKTDLITPVICLAVMLIARNAPAQTVPAPLIVANNTQLKAAATSTNASALRLGNSYPGDAEPLTFKWSSASCSPTAGDSGSQVPSNGGGCWLAQFPSTGADVREWGAIESSTTINNALTWAVNNGFPNISLATPGKLIFPPGVFTLQAAAAVTVPGNWSITIAGAGAEATVLKFPSGDNGFQITVSGQLSTFHIRDLTLASMSAPSAGTNGLTLIQADAFNVSSQSDVIGVTFRGADGVRATDGWANGVLVTGVANINFIGDVFGGPSPAAGNGIHLCGGAGCGNVSSAAQTGTQYNVSQSTFTGLTAGIYYDGYTQGLTVTGGSNFISNTYGIYVPGSLGAGVPSQLTFADSQCGFNTYCLSDGSGIYGELISNNLIFTQSSDIGVQTLCDSCNITGNNFGTSLPAGDTCPFGGTGISGGSAGTGGAITGNTFACLATGILLASGAQGIVVAGNHYGFLGLTNTSNLTTPDSNPHNLITGAPIFGASTVVSGAVNNGSGLVRLTVTSTAQFVSGESVIVAGVGGINGVYAAMVCPITVVDGTHMDLNYVTFGGSYTGGGVVSVLPP